MSLPKLIVGGVLAAVMLIFVSCSMTTVDTGNRGVKVRFGEVQGDALPEGLYFVNPFTTHITNIDTRVQKWSANLKAYTRDVQQADIQFVMNYRLDPAKAHTVFANVGVDWAQKLIGQVVFEEIKREVGQHEAVDIIAQRDAAARVIEKNVTGLLATRSVVVAGFQLTNIDFTDVFEHAVEAKVVAVQNAIAEKNRTVGVQEVARQQVEKAKGNADATILNAKADAESIRIRAQALEQNAKLVEWEAVQKWNGTLPQYVMGGSIPFINIPAGK